MQYCMPKLPMKCTTVQDIAHCHVSDRLVGGAVHSLSIWESIYIYTYLSGTSAYNLPGCCPEVLNNKRCHQNHPNACHGLLWCINKAQESKMGWDWELKSTRIYALRLSKLLWRLRRRGILPLHRQPRSKRLVAHNVHPGLQWGWIDKDKVIQATRIQNDSRLSKWWLSLCNPLPLAVSLV